MSYMYRYVYVAFHTTYIVVDFFLDRLIRYEIPERDTDLIAKTKNKPPRMSRCIISKPSGTTIECGGDVPSRHSTRIRRQCVEKNIFIDKTPYDKVSSIQRLSGSGSVPTSSNPDDVTVKHSNVSDDDDASDSSSDNDEWDCPSYLSTTHTERIHEMKLDITIKEIFIPSLTSSSKKKSKRYKHTSSGSEDDHCVADNRRRAVPTRTLQKKKSCTARSA